jgi:transcriptional regulator with XRE-family HTH domain
MSVDNSKQIMARNIKRYMEKKGVTNQQLCDALGFKYTTFMDWIKGVTYPRIGKVEAMAQYFGCEKSDLIEDKKEQPTEYDGLSEQHKALIDFAMSVPDDKAEMILRVMKSIVEAD